MNKQRRAEIEKGRLLLQQAIEILEPVHDEESEAYENMPESLQSSDRGEQASQAIDTLDNVLGQLRDADDELVTVVEGGL